MSLYFGLRSMIITLAPFLRRSIYLSIFLRNSATKSQVSRLHPILALDTV